MTIFLEEAAYHSYKTEAALKTVSFFIFCLPPKIS